MNILKIIIPAVILKKIYEKKGAKAAIQDDPNLEDAISDLKDDKD